ncbi:4'-phosphopantetheinyl transferase superfamily protein [Streptomyces sp. LHD-70]|uniref:4'-phosphopantetheinyl transferase superfamily protein n=1 Tax=Streptomyces sp. LHD-70 TaxID=3072140 RepID=UPI00280F4259|nr:4'-phosphopantetheinyl transferase superfamily protein [Streptomyces sp. LHD-70]MDQ8705985.1 4'-phosphopantetheinyl transferase superfamily protein [Streptomyces sp. LHD-70]
MDAVRAVRLGIDVTDARAWAARLTRCPGLAATAFTGRELSETGAEPGALASVWAIKEAVVKALGTGFAGIGWRGVEVRSPAGRPASVRLTGDLPPWVYDSDAVRLAVRGPHSAADAPRTLLAAVALTAPTGPGTHIVATARTDQVRDVFDGPRAGRAARAGAAVRRTAERAARAVLEPYDGPWTWTRTEQGAPLLRTRDGRHLPVALSHGAGITAALVAAPAPRTASDSTPTTATTSQQSLLLTIIDDDYLLEGVSASD